MKFRPASFNNEQLYSDSLRRHTRRDHEDPGRSLARATQACIRCRTTKARCQGGSPCTECSSKGHLCLFNDPVHLEPAQPDPEEELWEYGSGDDRINTPIGDIAQVDHYIHLYFTHFHQHWPILHRHTFSVADEPQLLLQAVIMIGLWVSGSPAAQEGARNLHSKLKLAILAQKVSRSQAKSFQFINHWCAGQLGTIARGRRARQRRVRQPELTMADCNLSRHSSLYHILITVDPDWSRT